MSSTGKCRAAWTVDSATEKKMVLMVSKDVQETSTTGNHKGGAGNRGKKETFSSLYIPFMFKILLCAYIIQNN